jgi:hypothetical protein
MVLRRLTVIDEKKQVSTWAPLHSGWKNYNNNNLLCSLRNQSSEKC